MRKDYRLISNDELTALAINNGLRTWNELLDYIKKLPYGRNKNRTDLTLVFTEKKGTCSSKHAVLKSIADLNNIPNVFLILGIYKMNQLNTPNIGFELTNHSLEYIPEAHCYLKIDNLRVDLTTNNAKIDEIKESIIDEIEIKPIQTITFKVEYHQKFLKNWILKNKIAYSFNEVWAIREKCIKNLSQTLFT